MDLGDRVRHYMDGWTDAACSNEARGRDTFTSDDWLEQAIEYRAGYAAGQIARESARRHRATQDQPGKR